LGANNGGDFVMRQVGEEPQRQDGLIARLQFQDRVINRGPIQQLYRRRRCKIGVSGRNASAARRCLPQFLAASRLPQVSVDGVAGDAKQPAAKIGFSRAFESWQVTGDLQENL
jgi:hypothetical protein